MRRPDPKRVLSVVVAIVTALALGLGLGVAIDDDHDGKPDRFIVQLPSSAPTQSEVDGAAAAGRQDVTVRAPASAVREVLASDAADHDGLKNETPPGAAPAEIEAAREQQDRLAASDQLPTVSPDAAPSQAGCTSAFVRNYSSRRGVRPRLLVLHYTVSANRPGVDDVNAVVNLFNTPSFAASSNYVIDREGNCKYIVRESDKAWTQATANPVSISWEIINSGREGTLISGAGKAKLARTLHDAAGRWDIPLQAGRVSGCSVTRPGVITHQQLGACGGGHVDVSPYQAEVAAITAAARGGKPVTSVDRATCRKINWWRRAGRPHGKAEQNAVRRRRALERRGVTCTARGPVRR